MSSVIGGFIAALLLAGHPSAAAVPGQALSPPTYKAVALGTEPPNDIRDNISRATAVASEPLATRSLAAEEPLSRTVRKTNTPARPQPIAAEGIPDVHHHIFEYGPGYGSGMETGSHIPGEYEP